MNKRLSKLESKTEVLDGLTVTPGSKGFQVGNLDVNGQLTVNGQAIGSIQSSSLLSGETQTTQTTSGAAGIKGATGAAGATGATGPQGPSGAATCPYGNCLSLQPSSPGTQETGNFNISGVGRADTTLLTPLVDTAAVVPLDVGTNNASAINLNQNTTIAANKSLIANGTATFQNATNSSTAFQIQDASGTQIVNVDTATTTNLISNPSFENSDISTWTPSVNGVLSRTTARHYVGNAALQVNTSGSSDGAGVGVSGLTPGNIYTFSAYLKSTDDASTINVDPFGSGICLTGQSAPSYAWNRVVCNFVASGTSQTIYVYQTDGTARTIYIDGAQLVASSAAEPFGIGRIELNGVIDSPISIQNSIDSAAAIDVQSAAGADVFSIDTMNNYVQTKQGAFLAGDANNSQYTYIGQGNITIISNINAYGSSSPISVYDINTGSFIDSLLDSASQAGYLNIDDPYYGAAILSVRYDGASQIDQVFAYNPHTSTYPLNVSLSSTNSTVIVGDASNGTSVTVDCGAASTCSFGATATAHTTTIGSASSTSGLTLQAGTGTISIGTSPSARTTQIATGAAAQTVTLGSTNGTSSLTLQAGTGTIAIGTSASARTTNIATGAAVQTVTLGSTNSTSVLTLQAGTGGLSITTQGTGGLNIGNNAVAQSINIGNGTGSTSVAINCGTGTCSLGNNAFAHTTSVGSSTGTATTNVQAGTGGLNISTLGIANTVQIGNTSGAVTQTINIGTNSTASSTNNVTIGSTIAGTTAIQGATTITNRTSGSADTLSISNSTSTGNIAVFKDNTTAVMTIADGGATTFQNQTDSTTALRIQNAAGTATLFTADTTNLVVTVAGTTSTFASLTLTNAHIKSTQTTAPTISTPGSCGTSPTASIVAGSTDTAGQFTVNAGTGSPGNCSVDITFNKAYGTAPKAVILTPATATGESKQVYVPTTTTTTFTATMYVAPAASESNTYYYWVIE